MVPLSLRTFLPMLALGIGGALVACGSDVIPTIVYPGDDGGQGTGSSGASSSSSSGGTASGSSGSPSSGSSSGSTSSSSSGSSSGSTTSSSSGSDGGPATCDMTGYWLVVQHSVAVSDGFKEIGHQYLYFDLSQKGDAVTVNHGLHCGLDVMKDPGNLLGQGSNVTFPLAVPALIAKQDEGQAYGSQPARTGTMTMMSSGSCQFHLNKYYTVRGATLAYYVTASNMMSTSMPVAMGQTPGSEDWDNDGQPGITLSVSGTATGNIYAAQRDFSEYFGTVRPGATKFEVGAVDPSGNPGVGPEQYALGYGNGCSAICGLSSMPDTCPSSGCQSEYFADWVKLDSPPGSNNSDICKYVVNMAPTVAPRASDASSMPTEAMYP